MQRVVVGQRVDQTTGAVEGSKRPTLRLVHARDALAAVMSKRPECGKVGLGGRLPDKPTQRHHALLRRHSRGTFAQPTCASRSATSPSQHMGTLLPSMQKNGGVCVCVCAGT